MCRSSRLCEDARPSLESSLEGAAPVGPAVGRVAPLRRPIRGDRVPVDAVPPRYVAEVRLDPGFLVHAQLSNQISFQGGPFLSMRGRKLLHRLGSAIGENTVAR